MGAKSKTKKITLERVIGTTTTNSHQLSVSSKSSHYAYLTGACITITDFLANKQVRFLISKCEVTSISFNQNADKVVSGDSSGELICWTWKKKKKLWKIEKAHKGRILACEVDGDDKYIATVGEDMMIKIWLLENGELVGANRISPSSSALKEGGLPAIRALCWSSDSKWLVTAGDNFVKYWYMSSLDDKKYSSSFGTNILDGRKANLCDADGQHFVSLSNCPDDPNSIYAVTKEGTLCSFGLSPRSLQKWVNLKTREAFSINVTEKSIVCGCSEGVIRVFTPKTLAYQGTLPKPPPIHSHLTAASINENVFKSHDGDHADAVACKISTDSRYVAAIYSDRSFIMWDISNMKRISKYRSFLSHGSCIWDVDILPDNSDSPLPDGTFVTCSEDGTLRFWNINHDNQERGPELRASIAEKSIFSRDLLHVVSLPRSEDGNKKIGVRCCKFLPSGCHVVSGDRVGNVRVHDMFKFNAITDQCAHDAEVLVVDAAEYEDGSTLIASGSRDSLIHLYTFTEDVGADHLSTLNNHTASITSVKFSSSGSKLLSCSADKTISFRSVTPQGNGFFSVKEDHVAQVPQGKIYDMDPDATHKYIITACSDKKLHIWNIQNGKSIRFYPADKKSEPLKVRTDPAGIHAVTSSSDKILRLYDFYSGACYAKFRGHSGVINAIRFTNDCKNIISVGSDGCILVWKLGAVLRNAMELRLSEIKKQSNRPSPVPVVDDIPTLESHSNLVEKLEKATTPTPLFVADDESSVPIILSDTGLPAWARPKTGDSAKTKTIGGPSEGSVWAQRAGAISLRPNGTLVDDDVQSLHAMSQRSNDSLSATNVQSVIAEEEDDVNLSEDDSDIEKEEDGDFLDDERVVFANTEEDKDGFQVASADGPSIINGDASATDDSAEEPAESSADLTPVSKGVESFDAENIRFVNENYGNLDKPAAPGKNSGVRQSFSAAFFRQSILQMKDAQKQGQPVDDSVELEDDISISDANEEEEAENLERTPEKSPSKSDASPIKDAGNQKESSDTESTVTDPGEIALKAGYGRVSNDTFGKNFREIAGEPGPLPKTPSSDEESEKTSAMKDDLRFLRKKYKIPTNISMSLKTQKAKNEADKGLEEYMRRRGEEIPSQEESTEKTPVEVETSVPEQQAAPITSETVTDSSPHDSDLVEEKVEIPSQKTEDASEEVMIETPSKDAQNTASEQVEEELTSSQTDDIAAFEEKIVALKPFSEISASPTKTVPERQSTPTKSQEGESVTQELEHTPFLKKNDRELPLPPRTPDVGQYSTVSEEVDAPRALHAFTPMPTFNKARGNKNTESIILKKSVDEYRLAMENLKQSFQTALSLYEEANTELQRSRLVYELPKEEEKPVTDILEGFENVFKQMYSKIDQRTSLKDSVSKESMDATLEKYSDILVQLVAKKMKALNEE